MTQEEENNTPVKVELNTTISTKKNVFTEAFNPATATLSETEPPKSAPKPKSQGPLYKITRASISIVWDNIIELSEVKSDKLLTNVTYVKIHTE